MKKIKAWFRCLWEGHDWDEPTLKFSDKYWYEDCTKCHKRHILKGD